MNKVKLTTICNPKQWKTLPTNELQEDGFPVYGANGVIGYYSEYNHEDPVIAITCRGATCGTINVTAPKSYVTGNAMCLDNLDSDVTLDYLYYCLLHYDFSNVISGSAQPQITRQGLEKVIVQICEKTKQKEIVSVLSNVEKLIQNQKRENQLFDELIKARFVEMFGDPIKNEKRWNKCIFEDITTKITDGEHGTVPRVEKDEGYLYFMARNITKDGTIDLSETSYVSEEIHKKIYKRCNPEKGDVLLVCVGATIGKSAVVPSEIGEFSMARSVALLKPNRDKVNGVFINALLQSDAIQTEIDNSSHAAAQAGLYTNMIKKLPAILPPLELQNEFETFVKQLDKSKFESILSQ